MTDSCAGCGVAISGADVLYTPDGRSVCAACFDKVEVVPPSALAGPWRGFAIAGAVVGAIPFGVGLASYDLSVVNDHVEKFVYRDWIAVVLGVVALTLGLMALWAGRKESLRRAVAVAAALGVLALGGYQIARGLGMFANPKDYMSMAAPGGASTEAIATRGAQLQTRPS